MKTTVLVSSAWPPTVGGACTFAKRLANDARMQALVGVVVLAGSLALDTDSSNRRTRNVNRGLANMGIYEGMNRILGGIRQSGEANLHIDAIAELSESFGTEAAPMVVNVEGQERRLTGTAEAQYESWRKLLKEIYKAETGFSENIEVGAPARAPETISEATP